MKALKIIVIALLFILILWINLPEEYTLKLPLGKKTQTITLRPPVIQFKQGDREFRKEIKTQLGLDLKGGSHLAFEADTSKVSQPDLQDAINATRDIIERRVNLFGVSEPVVQTIKSGNIYRISVDLPGVENVTEAVSLIGQTAQLSFKEMIDIDPKEATNTPIFLILSKETGLTGKDVKKATVTFNNQTGEPNVSLEFSKNGATMFADITKRNVGKPVGIYIDTMLISYPVVNVPILTGSAVIEGNFTVEDAKSLALAINSGALPVPVKLVEQRNIGPTLGAAEVKSSMIAGIFGLSMVFLFMIGYYGQLGIIASMGLIIYGLISFAIFRLIPVVLTLPGIAGFILSIGMAVDSNILIFERIKEEIRKGNNPQTAIRLGFGRAIDAIKDANITTLTVAFILFNPLNWEFLPQFGMVRGFALTLAIGVATSLFTGIVITRRLIDLFYKPSSSHKK